MVDFATILAELEEPSRPLNGTSLIGADIIVDASGNVQRQGRTKSRAASIAAAYGALSSERHGDAADAPPKPKARPARLPDRERLLRELRLAETSRDDLRALRRRLAWLCHPDRHDGADAARAEKIMAEFNARIDEAMKTLDRRRR